MSSISLVTLNVNGLNNKKSGNFGESMKRLRNLVTETHSLAYARGAVKGTRP